MFGVFQTKCEESAIISVSFNLETSISKNPTNYRNKGFLHKETTQNEWL